MTSSRDEEMPEPADEVKHTLSRKLVYHSRSGHVDLVRKPPRASTRHILKRTALHTAEGASNNDFISVLGMADISDVTRAKEKHACVRS